jgi:hypothetical protein
MCLSWGDVMVGDRSCMYQGVGNARPFRIQCLAPLQAFPIVLFEAPLLPHDQGLVYAFYT